MITQWRKKEIKWLTIGPGAPPLSMLEAGLTRFSLGNSFEAWQTPWKHIAHAWNQWHQGLKHLCHPGNRNYGFAAGSACSPLGFVSKSNESCNIPLYTITIHYLPNLASLPGLFGGGSWSCGPSMSKQTRFDQENTIINSSPLIMT